MSSRWVFFLPQVSGWARDYIRHERLADHHTLTHTRTHTAVRGEASSTAAQLPPTNPNWTNTDLSSRFICFACYQCFFFFQREFFFRCLTWAFLLCFRSQWGWASAATRASDGASARLNASGQSNRWGVPRVHAPGVFGLLHAHRTVIMRLYYIDTAA